MKETQSQRAFGEDIYTLSDQVHHSRNLILLCKTSKTSGKMVDQGMNDKQVCESVLFCNHPGLEES
jgi:hypothetical protein